MRMWRAQPTRCESCRNPEMLHRVRLALIFALGLLLPSAAWAHASLLSSQPADGVRLDHAPTEAILRFNEAIGLISLRLVGPGGGEIAPEAPPALAGGTVRASYPAGLAQGVYVLSYRVTSADSHPVAGAVAFGVGVAPAASGGGAAQASRWQPPTEVVRWLYYGALMAVAGGALFRGLVAAPPEFVLRALSRMAWAGVALAGLQLGLRGALLADMPWSGLAQLGTWRIGLGTTLLASLVAGAAGLVLCSAGGRRLGLLGAVVAVGGFAISGHAATAEPRWLMAPLVGLHTMAVAFWLGAFWPLWGLLAGPAGPAGRAAQRFSVLALGAVSVLVVTGFLIALVQIERIDAFASPYGVLVLGKLAGLAGLIVLAAWNRERLTPSLLAGQAGAAARLRGSIGAEAALAAAVLGLTSVLSLTPPPRAELRSAPAFVMARARNIMAHFEVSPARAGVNRIGVTLFPDSLEPKEMWLTMTQPAAGVGPLRRPLRLDGCGGWEIEGPELAIPGRWTLGLEVLLTDFDEVAMSADLDVR